MGQCSSLLEGKIGLPAGDIIASNDYELVIRSSKELEYVLEYHFGAQGKGLHEKANSIGHMISPPLAKKIHYLATIRNKLVHEFGFNHIPDRPAFISNFQAAQAELQDVLRRHRAQTRGPPPKSSAFCPIQ